MKRILKITRFEKMENLMDVYSLSSVEEEAIKTKSSKVSTRTNVNECLLHHSQNYGHLIGQPNQD
ncbi:hypothetical protein [Flammeovirga aprica]|uniref:Uncharacterized protein n=1 Tax=Flammeovirga aprica JL-4 TaxID=694437 RepID=A0A7X9XB85_9BACT|nr:hypothetical protein [Flammeovirga aprica]NME70378.1 hypothetical protein [Flammeovirga aprica JL-4]